MRNAIPKYSVVNHSQILIYQLSVPNYLWTEDWCFTVALQNRYVNQVRNIKYGRTRPLWPSVFFIGDDETSPTSSVPTECESLHNVPNSTKDEAERQFQNLIDMEHKLFDLLEHPLTPMTIIQSNVEKILEEISSMLQKKNVWGRTCSHIEFAKRLYIKTIDTFHPFRGKPTCRNQQLWFKAQIKLVKYFLKPRTYESLKSWYKSLLRIILVKIGMIQISYLQKILYKQKH